MIGWYLEDGWKMANTRERRNEGMDVRGGVCERRRMSCPFEDKSERQRSEELYNYTHTHIYKQMRVCARSCFDSHTCKHKYTD